jgi:formamidopyrimidine-DNA glycosylase
LEIGWDAFYERLRSRRAMVKSLLLDQRFLRGIGNIYADESLFRSGIHPAAIAAGLSRARALRLFDGIRDTLAHAIERGGSSISDYVDAQGRAGWFQLEHQVYQRTGQACLRCGSLIRRMVIASRSTHFCPRCQRGPKRPSRAMSARKRKR